MPAGSSGYRRFIIIIMFSWFMVTFVTGLLTIAAWSAEISKAAHWVWTGMLVFVWALVTFLIALAYDDEVDNRRSS